MSLYMECVYFSCYGLCLFQLLVVDVVRWTGIPLWTTYRVCFWLKEIAQPALLIQTLLSMRCLCNTISYQLFWSVIQLISRNQRAVSPEAQPRVIQPSDCEI